MLISLPLRAVALTTLVVRIGRWLVDRLLMQPVRTVRRWWWEQKAMDALLSLDDRTLSDIGLSRCDIAHVVRHGRQPIERATAASNDNDPVDQPDKRPLREAA